MVRPPFRLVPTLGEFESPATRGSRRHAGGPVAYRPTGQRLRQPIPDPLARPKNRYFATLLVASGMPVDESRLRNSVNSRSAVLLFAFISGTWYIACARCTFLTAAEPLIGPALRLGVQR